MGVEGRGPSRWIPRGKGEICKIFLAYYHASHHQTFNCSHDLSACRYHFDNHCYYDHDDRT